RPAVIITGRKPPPASSTSPGAGVAPPSHQATAGPRNLSAIRARIRNCFIIPYSTHTRAEEPEPPSRVLIRPPLTVAPGVAAEPLGRRGCRPGRAPTVRHPGTARGGRRRRGRRGRGPGPRRHRPDVGSRWPGRPAATSCAYLCPDGQVPAANGVPPG